MAQRKKTSQPTVDKVLNNCYQLSVPELKFIRDALNVLIDYLEEDNLTEKQKKAVRFIASDGKGKRGSFGYTEKKSINGNGPYCYLRFKRDGIHHSFYLGKTE